MIPNISFGNIIIQDLIKVLIQTNNQKNPEVVENLKEVKNLNMIYVGENSLSREMKQNKSKH